MHENSNFEIKAFSEALDNFRDFELVCRAIKKGKYDYILNTNILQIKENIEKGIISNNITTDKIFQVFASNNVEYLNNIIKSCKELLSYKKTFLDEIELKKTYMEYDINDKIFPLSTYNYLYALDLVALADETLKKLHFLLDFYLKNEVLIYDLHEREENIKLSIKNKEAYNVIRRNDKKSENMGIIVYKDYVEQKKKVAACTIKDIMLSEILGVPFPKSVSIFNFYDENLSQTHLKIIDKEKEKREFLKSKYLNDELGYIPGLVVSKRELLDNGFNIEELNWKPLRIEPEKKGILKIYRSIYKFFSKFKKNTNADQNKKR